MIKISNSQYALLRQLKEKKNRTNYRLFVAEGQKVSSQLIMSKKFVVEMIIISNNCKEIDKIYLTNKTYAIDNLKFKSISNLIQTDGILVVFQQIEYEYKNEEQKLTLILDDVNNPGNLGNIIRTANWYGIENIICSETSVELYNPKVIQASAGSIANVKVHYKNIEKFLKEIQSNNDNKLFTTVLNGKDYRKVKLGKNNFILFGNEHHGTKEEHNNLCHEKITIPSYGNNVESLNLMVSCGIICAEFSKLYEN